MHAQEAAELNVLSVGACYHRVNPQWVHYTDVNQFDILRPGNGRHAVSQKLRVYIMIETIKYYMIFITKRFIDYIKIL